MGWRIHNATRDELLDAGVLCCYLAMKATPRLDIKTNGCLFSFSQAGIIKASRHFLVLSSVQLSLWSRLVRFYENGEDISR